MSSNNGLKLIGSSTDYTTRYSKWNTPHLISKGKPMGYSIDSVMELTKEGQVIFKKVVNFLPGASLFEIESVKLSESLSEHLQVIDDLIYLNYNNFSFDVVTGRQIGKHGSRRTIAKIGFFDYSRYITKLPGGGLGFTEHIFTSNLIAAFKEFILLDDYIGRPSYRY